MFIDAQVCKYSSELRFFLLLKLLYKCGKTKLNYDELSFIELIDKIKDRKTTKKHITFLQSLGWIKYNSKTGYYILNSFDKIRKENNFKVRLAFPIDFNNYFKIKAVTGAVIYGYLHKGFWRYVKREKSVKLKGITYYFLSSKFNYKKKYAPVSVIWVEKFFKIPQATASRLKNAAFKEKLIQLKKNYSKEYVNKAMISLYCKYNDFKQNIVYHNGNYHLQLIDTIYPLFYFTKRSSVET